MNVQKMNAVHSHVYDCIGIGFGPSNIALAVALEERGALSNSLFLESQSDFLWHPGMLIPGSDIQHNPLRDFVTPRNPQSRFGFLSYLKAKNRLFDYLNLASSYPPRSDYAEYVKWVAQHFGEYVRLNTNVSDIQFTQDGQLLQIQTDGTQPKRFFARSLAFGTGRSKHIPEVFAGVMGEDVVHLTHYLPAKERWTTKHKRPRVCVLGGSQSAIEIVLDLSNCADVVSVSRSFGFKQKDLSAFTESIYYPEFVDYFYNSGTESQNSMMDELWRSNYGAADPDVIAQLNFKLYEQKVKKSDGLQVIGNSSVREVEKLTDGQGYVLTLDEKHTGEIRKITVDGIVLATGYQNFGDRSGQEPFHPLLNNIVSQNAKFRSDGGIDIDRDYRLLFDDNQPKPAIYMNGLCEASHGFGDAGSFSLLSVRSDEIAQSVQDFLRSMPTVTNEETAYAK